jgi:Tol biopolymer transport system component/outer membrane protein assembly factor BamB
MTGCTSGSGPVVGWAGITVEGDNLYLAYADQVRAFASGNTAVTTSEDGDALAPAWSHDGTTLAYTQQVDGHYQLFVKPEGQAPVQITDDPTDHFSPAFSPEDNSLVYVAKDDLYIVDLPAPDAEADAEGEETSTEDIVPRQITDTAAAEANPDWSQANDLIVYTSDEAGNFDLYTIAPDGSNTTQLTTTTADELNPAWSPNGKFIAYAVDLHGNNDIYTFNYDDSTQGRKQITEDRADDIMPSWVPGSRLLFVSDRAGSYDLYTVNIDEYSDSYGKIVAITESEEIDEFVPRSQPGDETEGWILYQAKDKEGVSQIFRTSLEGEAPSFGESSWGATTFPPEPNVQVQFYAPPTVAGDRIYIGGYDRRVHAVNRADGTPVQLEKTDDEGNPLTWATNQLEDIIATSITVGDEMIYVPVANRNVLAISTADPSQVVWTFETEHGVWATPLLLDGTLYITSLDHHVYAVDAQTGEQIWRSQDLNGAVPSPATHDAKRGLLYVSTLNSQVYALNVADGSIENVFNAADWVWGEPTLYDDTLYIADLSGGVYAIDADDWDNVLWKTPEQATAGGVRAPLLVTDTHVFAAGGDGYLRAFDRENGTQLWKAPGGGSEAFGALYSRPVYMSGLVVVSPMNNQEIYLLAYDAEDGSPVWRFPTP